MKWTKEMEQECIEINIHEAKEVIRSAKQVNKGCYIHSINSKTYRIENLLKKKLQFGSEDFKEMCSLKLNIAGWLFLNR